jgi:hypothetical protein
MLRLLDPSSSKATSLPANEELSLVDLLIPCKRKQPQKPFPPKKPKKGEFLISSIPCAKVSKFVQKKNSAPEVEILEIPSSSGLQTRSTNPEVMGLDNPRSSLSTQSNVLLDNSELVGPDTAAADNNEMSGPDIIIPDIDDVDLFVFAQEQSFSNQTLVGEPFKKSPSKVVAEPIKRSVLRSVADRSTSHQVKCTKMKKLLHPTAASEQKLSFYSLNFDDSVNQLTPPHTGNCLGLDVSRTVVLETQPAATVTTFLQLNLPENEDNVTNIPR